MNNIIRYVIIQCGGRGKRLGYLTVNKPKALISVNRRPIILRQMDAFPKAKFIVIGDYKYAVLEKYLKYFARRKIFFVRSTKPGTSSGIKEALGFIPRKEPFLVLWSDLLFSQEAFPKKLNIRETNCIGLSKNLPCRYSFANGEISQRFVPGRGIVGVYIFKNKKEIEDISDAQEICDYLSRKKIQLFPFYLKSLVEIKDTDSYRNYASGIETTRPFNRLEIKRSEVVKIPIDDQGKKLFRLETNWYRSILAFKLPFIPRIKKFSPLVMEKIDGLPLFKFKFARAKKRSVLLALIASLKKLHSLKSAKTGDISNDYEAILSKTKKRLDSISGLIPNIESDFFIINNKRCINFYKKWYLVERALKRHFGNEYKIIHGDPTFSNILYISKTRRIVFIDPRGYYGRCKLIGDEDYDWAKLYYSFKGNYDQLNAGNFRLKIGKNRISASIGSSGWEKLEKEFFEEIGREPSKIKAYHAIIWLSLTTYVWDDYDAILTAFFNGIFLMQELEEHYKKS